jgi:transcription elongation GreA/GreB family factor
LQRRQEEYQDLVNKRIPANVKDIALARSYGDLRENHEYKSAKEMQRVLQRRKAELERDLGRARGTDWANVRTDVVGPGTVIHVTEIQSDTKERIYLLGAWDGDPDKNILSYLTPFAKIFLGQPVGGEVNFSSEGKVKKYRIDGITAYVPAA